MKVRRTDFICKSSMWSARLSVKRPMTVLGSTLEVLALEITYG